MSPASRTATIVLCAIASLAEPVVPASIAEAQVQPAPSPVPPPAPLPVPAPPPAPTAADPARRAGKVDPEVRLDGIIARLSAVQVGAGFTVAAGTYLRTGAAGAVGFSRNGLSGRVDGVARFHFDPFRQSRWAPYGGGGISGRFDRDEKARAYLLLILGLDGPVYSGATPSFELGLGGGARVGVIFRRATVERR